MLFLPLISAGALFQLQALQPVPSEKAQLPGVVDLRPQGFVEPCALGVKTAALSSLNCTELKFRFSFAELRPAAKGVLRRRPQLWIPPSSIRSPVKEKDEHLFRS